MIMMMMMTTAVGISWLISEIIQKLVDEDIMISGEPPLNTDIYCVKSTIIVQLY